MLFSLNYPKGSIEGSEKKLEFSSSTQTSNSGYFSLNWASPNEDADFKLQMSQSPDFSGSKTIYEGPDFGHFISGLKNGTYFFQLCEIKQEGESSDSFCASVLEIKVKHHSLSSALGFFAVGLFAFAAIIFVIVRGNAIKEGMV